MSGGGSGGQSDSRAPSAASKRTDNMAGINEGSFHMEKLKQEALSPGFDSAGASGSLAPVDLSHINSGPAKDTATSGTVSGEDEKGRIVSDAFAPPQGSVFPTPSLMSSSQEEARAAGPGGFSHSGEGISSTGDKRDDVKLKLNADLRHLPGGLAAEDKTGHHADGRI